MTKTSKKKISTENSKLRQSIGLWVYAALMELCGGGEANNRYDIDLKKIAYESVSFPNGEHTSQGNHQQSQSLCHIGKPHDIEVKAAAKYFYKAIYRCNCKDLSSSENVCSMNCYSIRASKVKPSQRIFILSNLGLSREIRSASDLGHLLAVNMEGMPDSIRISDNIRTDKNGVICIVSRGRQLVLKEANRLQCPTPWCVKWGKGEKGLWWHQQKEHGTKHSTAVSTASSVANESAMIVYDPIKLWSQDCHHYKKFDKSNNKKSGGFELIKENNLEGLRSLINLERFDPKVAFDKNGSGAVLWAAGCGHLQILKYLIKDCSCNPEQLQQGKRSFSSRTPLHWAARNGHLNIVQFLVNECLVDINAATQDGTTAFCWASWQGHIEVMKFLKEKNADVHTQNIFGCNAVQWAAQGEIDTSGMKFLLSVSCDFLLINSNGHGAIHKCAQRGKISICKWLFDSSDIPFEIVHVGPDTEQLCPSDLAGIEGYNELAKWLAKVEVNLALNAYNSGQCIPIWLQKESDTIKNFGKGALGLNSHYYSERWESRAAIKRMAIASLKIN